MKNTKNTAGIDFENILRTLHEEGITTRAALMADQPRYDEFWLALVGFCRLALDSKTSGVSSGGEIRPGNARKVYVLEKLGAAEKRDLTIDCALRIVDKLDKVLLQPLWKQKFYCHKICNNIVNDCFRKFPPCEIKVVSLDEKVMGTGADGGDRYTYADVVGSDTYEAGRICIENECIQELKDRQEKKILRETAALRKHPAEVMARLACTYLEKKPRELAVMIDGMGCESAFAKVLFQVSEKFGIDLAKLRKVIAGGKPTAKALKADTGKAGQVAGQISRLVYRADQRLSK